ncbi:intercellular adhesion molecule 5-like [Anas acuta]|uniref:intercellular adhesion molecule 5-like n=1 Tax=Anas acuta TaxID=28680 RepID=UPI0035C8C2FE
MGTGGHGDGEGDGEGWGDTRGVRLGATRCPWLRGSSVSAVAVPRGHHPALPLVGLLLLAQAGRAEHPSSSAPVPGSSPRVPNSSPDFASGDPPFSLSVTGSASEVSYGGAALINCSTTCADPNATVGVETSLTKEEAARGQGWLAVRLSNITEPVSDIVCYSSCFGQRKVSSFRMLAYDFPEPVLLVRDPNTTYNHLVTLSCSAAPSQPPGVQLRLRSRRRPPAPWQEGSVSVQLTVHEEDDGDEFVCDAQLWVGDQMLNKSSDAVKLNVMYLPQLDDGSCPPSQNWTEGEKVTLRCQARGNPRPHVVCKKDGTSLIPGQWHTAKRAHTGTFRCVASSKLGTVGCNITVWVQYHDINVGLIVAVVLVVLGALAFAGITYGIYYRKKKIQEYQLRERQRRLEMEQRRLE